MTHDPCLRCCVLAFLVSFLASSPGTHHWGSADGGGRNSRLSDRMIFSDVGVGWIFSPWLPLLGVSKNCVFSPPIIHGLIGFSMIFTIHFGGFSPYFWKQPYFSNCILQVLGFQKSWPFLLFKNGNKKSPFSGWNLPPAFGEKKLDAPIQGAGNDFCTSLGSDRRRILGTNRIFFRRNGHEMSPMQTKK